MKPYLGTDPDSNNLMRIASDCRSERVAKFKQLLRIQRSLDSAARFAGRATFAVE
jgi:enolase